MLTVVVIIPPVQLSSTPRIYKDELRTSPECIVQSFDTALPIKVSEAIISLRGCGIPCGGRVVFGPSPPKEKDTHLDKFRSQQS